MSTCSATTGAPAFGPPAFGPPAFGPPAFRARWATMADRFPPALSPATINGTGPPAMSPRRAWVHSSAAQASSAAAG